jgi:hypothetical protein
MKLRFGKLFLGVVKPFRAMAARPLGRLNRAAEKRIKGRSRVIPLRQEKTPDPFLHL